MGVIFSEHSVIMLLDLCLVRFFFDFYVWPVGGLSWLHVKYTISYRIVELLAVDTGTDVGGADRRR